MPLGKDVDLKILADMTDGYSGADIEGLCREAAMTAVRNDWKVKPVTMKHFELALEETRPSLSPKDIERFSKIAESVKKRQPQESKILSGYV